MFSSFSLSALVSRINRLKSKELFQNKITLKRPNWESQPCEVRLVVSHEDIFVLDILENQQHISQLRLNFITGQTLKRIAIRSFPLQKGVFLVSTFDRGVFLSSISQ